jgi:hypothetical protein
MGASVMDRIRAYAELAVDLDRYRRLPYEELVRRVDGPSVERSVDGLEGPLTIEIRFRWAGSEGSAVQVSATVYGPSSWKLERLDEAVTITRPDFSPTMPIDLSPETRRRLHLLFRPSDQAEAEELLVQECGNNLPFLENSDEYGLERFRFAALKLSDGDLNKLYEEVGLAQQDWRDLLVAAGFAEDVNAHKHWLA